METVCALGHSTHPIEEFMKLLRSANYRGGKRPALSGLAPHIVDNELSHANH